MKKIRVPGSSAVSKFGSLFVIFEHLSQILVQNSNADFKGDHRTWDQDSMSLALLSEAHFLPLEYVRFWSCR